MACVNPDGIFSPSGKLLLEVVEEPATAEEVAKATGLPLFRVRSGLRELARADLVSEEWAHFAATARTATKQFELTRNSALADRRLFTDH
jgi:DNA-binding transcriptional regulator GbsR (MarR family)